MQDSISSEPSPSGTLEPRHDTAQAGSPKWRGLLLRWLVGFGLLLALVILVDPQRLLDAVRHADWEWAPLVLLTTSIYLTLGGINVWILLRSLADIRLMDFLRVYSLSWAASLVLPGQLGDATQIVLLRGQSIPTSLSTAAYVVDKCLSLGWMVCVVLFGVAWLLPAPEWRTWLLIFVAIGIGTIGGLLFFALYRILGTRRNEVEDGREGRGFVARFRQWLAELLRCLASFRATPELLAVNLGITIIKWLTMGFTFLFAFRAFGSWISYLEAAVVPIMSSFVGYIPITVGGAGTMEWTAVVLFQQLGRDATTVVSAFLFQRVMLLGVGLILVAAIGRPGRKGAQALPLETGGPK